MISGETYSSWCLVDAKQIIKNTDYTTFRHGGTVVPMRFRWFWKVDELACGARFDLVLRYKEEDYSAYIGRTQHGMTRLYWYKDLKEKIEIDHPNYMSYGDTGYPSLLFKRVGKQKYMVTFIDGNYYADNLHVDGEKEGRVISYYSTRHERSPKNRKACIDANGLYCAACGFNFREVFGELGEGFIEVHHRKALNEFKEAVKIDPITDLTPVCSNCHSMIHRKPGKVLSIDELKAILNRSTK